ncbi:MAG TPA: SRPBCC family protein [Solirubrobacteraceae bacterium]|nr:SRPBCC family protein [Solirubrobacteraceae bacterium]
MARYAASVESPGSLEDVFSYLSDFSSTEEWDPGVVRAERLGEGPIAVGTRFHLVASFLGRENELTYDVVEYAPPHAITLRGENATVVSLDRITFEPLDGGTRVTYDAELTLKGPLKLADPLLGLAFGRVGGRALAGLRRTIGVRAPARLPALLGRSLDGREYDLPQDLGHTRSFVVVAFRREQQALVDEWLPWLLELEASRSDLAVYELPVLSSAYGPVRWFIDGGMARGVAEASARARTITVYADVDRVVGDLGLTGTDTIAVLLIERSGGVLASVLGGFDEHKAQALASALEPEPEPEPQPDRG